MPNKAANTTRRYSCTTQEFEDGMNRIAAELGPVTRPAPRTPSGWGVAEPGPEQMSDEDAWATSDIETRDNTRLEQRWRERRTQRAASTRRTPAFALAFALLASCLPALAVEKCQPIPDGKGGTTWARKTLHGWSAASCEVSITFHHTARVNAPEVRRVSPTTCTAWLPAKASGAMVLQAHKLCTDAMNAEAAKQVGR